MTISESIIQWLRGWDGGFELDDSITTEQLREYDEAYGLFKAPSDTYVEFVDGSRDVTAYYQFLARQPSQTDALRMDAQEWMEALDSWIRAQNKARKLPKLDGGRVCSAVWVSGSFAMQDQTEASMVYQITLAITYFEGAKNE